MIRNGNSSGMQKQKQGMMSTEELRHPKGSDKLKDIQCVALIHLLTWFNWRRITYDSFTWWWFEAYRSVIRNNHLPKKHTRQNRQENNEREVCVWCSCLSTWLINHLHLSFSTWSKSYYACSMKASCLTEKKLEEQELIQFIAVEASAQSFLLLPDDIKIPICKCSPMKGVGHDKCNPRKWLCLLKACLELHHMTEFSYSSIWNLWSGCYHLTCEMLSLDVSFVSSYDSARANHYRWKDTEGEGIIQECNL